MRSPVCLVMVSGWLANGASGIVLVLFLMRLAYSLLILPANVNQDLVSEEISQTLLTS